MIRIEINIDNTTYVQSNIKGTIQKKRQILVILKKNKRVEKPKKSYVQMLSSFSSLFHNNKALVELGK